MFVIERQGVSWDERFYAGTTTFFPWRMWGDLEGAVIFQEKHRAVRMSYKIDSEAGSYTTVAELDSFSNK